MEIGKKRTEKVEVDIDLTEQDLSEAASDYVKKNDRATRTLLRDESAETKVVFKTAMSGDIEAHVTVTRKTERK